MKKFKIAGCKECKNGDHFFHFKNGYGEEFSVVGFGEHTYIRAAYTVVFSLGGKENLKAFALAILDSLTTEES